jgi:uncharacterized membrane protein
VGWVSYLLHLVVAVAAVVPGAQVGAGLLIVALIIDLVKKGDAEGTWQASHFAWRIRTVIWAGVLYVVTSPLFLLLYLPGAIAWAVISIWFLYRIVKGMVRMNASQAMPD